MWKSFYKPPHNWVKLFNLIDLSFCFYLTQWANSILSQRHKIQMNRSWIYFAFISLHHVAKSCNVGNDRNATFLLFIYTINMQHSTPRQETDNTALGKQNTYLHQLFYWSHLGSPISDMTIAMDVMPAG